MTEPAPFPTFGKPDPMIGTPEQDSECFPGQQSYADTCAIRCQEHILSEYWGIPIDETSLIQEAMDHGWYVPNGGTSPEDVGKLLELHGVAINRFQDANIFNIANELAQGHKVIIGVDSGELWKTSPILERIEDALGIQQADHAVVVTGIDTTDPNNVQVIISDPGSGEAKASYPMTQFIDAWKDGNFFMVSTQQPPPEFLNHPSMINFDYDVGHIPYIGNISYDELQSYEHDPEALSDRLSAHPETQIPEPGLQPSLENVDHHDDLEQDSVHSEGHSSSKGSDHAESGDHHADA